MRTGLHDGNQIHADMIVEDVLSRYPVTTQVFMSRRMHCFGCPIARFETVADACDIYRQPLQPMLADLNRVIQRADRSRSGA